MDPTTISDVFRLEMEEGSLADLEQGGMIVSRRVAERESLEVGDTVVTTFALTGTVDVPVRGVFEAQGTDIEFVLDDGTYAENYSSSQDFAVLATFVEGVDIAAGTEAVEQAIADVPTAEVLDTQALRERLDNQVNQLLGLVFALLFLSVLIALFGIVNTLALSVLERVRELGLLRAVGATRSQVRSMVRWESVLIAVLGATFGLGVGVLFAWLLSRSLADFGLAELVVPVGQLAVAIVLAALAGVVAGILPARRAARVDVLRAITVE